MCSELIQHVFAFEASELTPGSFEVPCVKRVVRYISGYNAMQVIGRCTRTRG